MLVKGFLIAIQALWKKTYDLQYGFTMFKTASLDDSFVNYQAPIAGTGHMLANTGPN